MAMLFLLLFGQICLLEKKDYYTAQWKTYNLLYLVIFNEENYVLFKMSASCYSKNFANLSLDIL